MHKVLIHYGEIGLKGKNIRLFEDKLIASIKRAGAHFEIEVNKVQRQQKRMIAHVNGDEAKVIEMFSKIMGIKYFSLVEEIPADLDSLLKQAKVFMAKMKHNDVKTVAFKTKRIDKNFALKSPEVNKELGEIANAHDIKVDYKGADNTFYCEISKDEILCFGDKYLAPGGFPVGVTGKVLVLLSGGIDSPVAAWQMMRRGCKVDFLHIHSFGVNKKVVDSKIKDLVKLLNDYQYQAKLHVVPYSIYEVLAMGQVESKYDLVFFKHYLLRLAQAVAKEHKYDAIVTGDNLAQVASQTMENLQCAQSGIEALTFRPLLTAEKQEIVDQAQAIGTFENSIQPYKDCCSILTKKPSTKTRLSVFQKVVAESNLEDILEKTLAEVETFDI